MHKTNRENKGTGWKKEDVLRRKKRKKKVENELVEGKELTKERETDDKIV